MPVIVPATTVAEIGDEFMVTLKNWNQCNAYDNNLLDGNAFNPVNGVSSQWRQFTSSDHGTNCDCAFSTAYVCNETRSGSGPVQTVFCIGDIFSLMNKHPASVGHHSLLLGNFFDNPLGTGLPLSTSTSAIQLLLILRAGRNDSTDGDGQQCRRQLLEYI